MPVLAAGLFIDDDFMMSLFAPLYEQLPELQEFLDWYFEEKQNYVAGGQTKLDRKKGMKLVREELFYPKRIENRETHATCLLLAQELASTLILEFQDTTKVTCLYLSKLDGEYSTKNLTEEQLEEGYGIRANNDTSEGNFAVFDDALSSMGRGALSRAAGQSQSRYNGDMQSDIDSLVSGRKCKSEKVSKPLGAFHLLPQEMQDALIATAKETSADTHRSHVDALERQRQYREQKRKDLHMSLVKKSEKKFMEASWLHQQFHSPRCWNTAKKAMDEFGKLPSDAQKKKYTKEQILIRYIGLGWEEAYHPWSKGKHTYTAVELLEHLVKVVIPLSKTKKYHEKHRWKCPEFQIWESWEQNQVALKSIMPNSLSMRMS